MTTVLQIIPHLGAGGAEQACIDVATGLKTAGHRTIVVSAGGARITELKTVGAEHIQRSVDSKNPLTMMMNAQWLAQLIKQQKIDIIHARSRAPAWTAYWATRVVPCHFVTTFHAAYKFGNPLKKFYNSVMAKSDRIIAISQFIARHIQENYRTNPAVIKTIPRGIDFDKFVPEKVTAERRAKLQRSWGIKENERIILLPSRISPIKGQETLIEAIALLPPDCRDVTAVILGDDQGRASYRQKLDRLIAVYNLQTRIKIVSHCDDMPAAYSLATVVVAPSLVPEGFGRVPVEAMAMGIPVIVSDCGGLSETVQQGVTGWRVAPGNIQQWAETLTQALKIKPDQRKLMADAAIQQARQYDKRKMVADTLVVYRSLMSGQ